MKVIGIDPGTNCGWSVVEDNTLIASGVWDLSGSRHEGGGMRYLRVRCYLMDLIKEHQPTAVAYEIVRRHVGTDAAHIYGGIIATIATVCEELEIPYSGIAVKTAKVVATGRGNASKEEMVAAANTKWALEITDDNQADACWMAAALIHELTT